MNSMKQKQSIQERSRFGAWLLSLPIAFLIIAALIFSGVQKFNEQLADMQRNLDTMSNELAQKDVELKIASIVVVESHTELFAFNWAYQLAACVLNESINFAAYVNGERREFSNAESARYLKYQNYVADQAFDVNPMRHFCEQRGVDETMLEVWWQRTFTRLSAETGLDGPEAATALEPYGGILVPHSTISLYLDKILAELIDYVEDWPPELSDQAVYRLWFDPART